MDNTANLADLKLSYLEPGQFVTDLSGTYYRVASKVSGPGGIVIKLANRNGEPVSTPDSFTPVSIGIARLAASLRYHLAYDKNLDLYITEYCKREGLPVPIGPDGKPFRWAKWFQSYFFPKLYVPNNHPDTQTIRDEAIFDMVNTVLGERGVLSKFKSKIKDFHKTIRKLDEAKQLTVYLVKNFQWRLEETNRKLREQHPQNEISMVQPGDNGEEYNLLETEEHSIALSDFQSIEAERDVAKLRHGFGEWLHTKLTPKAADTFLVLFDIYWDWVSGAGEDSQADTIYNVTNDDNDDDLSSREKKKKIKEQQRQIRIERERLRKQRPSWLPARRELEPQWQEQTDLNTSTLYYYIGRLAELLAQYIKGHRRELGNSNIFVRLMSQIDQERQHLKKGPRIPKYLPSPKPKAMPAHASALNLAGIENQKTASTGLNCVFVEAKPGIWYYLLEDWNSPEDSWDWRENATAYGPFNSEEEAHEHLSKNHANPGGFSISRYEPKFDKDSVLQNLISKAQKSTTHHWGSVKTAKLIHGENLTPEMRQQVLDSFPYRWTVDNSQRLTAYKSCDTCDIAHPFIGGDASGHNHPTIPLQTDEEWIREHAFYFTNDGRLNPRRHAEPAYLAKEQKSAASNKLPKGFRVTLKKDRLGFYYGQIWKNGIFVGICSVGDERQSVARTVAIDWAWEMSGEERPPNWTGQELDFSQMAPSLEIHRYLTNNLDISNHTDTNAPNYVPDWITEGVKYLKAHPELANLQRKQLRRYFWDSKDRLPWLYEDKKQAASQLPCCGGWHGKHKPNCKVYDENFEQTVKKLNELPKRKESSSTDKTASEEDIKLWLEPSIGTVHLSESGDATTFCGEAIDNHEPTDIRTVEEAMQDIMCPDCFNGVHQPVKEASEPLQQLRPDITPGDAGRLPHGRTQGSLKEAGYPSKLSPGHTTSCATKYGQTCNCPHSREQQREKSMTIPEFSMEDKVRLKGLGVMGKSKSSAGPISPQQMQQQNVQNAQGKSTQPQPPQPPNQTPPPQQPNIAITPNEENDIPLKHTVPPDLPNQMYHMGSLKTEQDTPEMREEVEVLAEVHPEAATHKSCYPVYEHGQWWLVCHCGVIWSVVDAEGPGSIEGLNLEHVSGTADIHSSCHNRAMESQDDD